MTEDDNDLVGQVVEERYRIEAQLGSGGMGAVYRARHVKVGREVAIKVLHDHLLADPTMVERFEREAAVAARLSHKNVIAVIDVGETCRKQKLMVLELARGTCLAEIVEGGALPGPRVVNLVAQLLAGLEHAHGHGLVHRDLKPENVIVEIDEHGIEVPKIVDFGIAMLRGDTASGGNNEKRLTTAGTVLGTPQYMAPEHAQGRDVDPRCDLFSLGVMTYEMLAGRSPFDGTGVELAIANITQDPPAICERSGATVDPLLEAFARRLMARRVRDRFQSARAALDVLELIEAHPDAAREILFPAPRGKTPAPRERSTVLGTMAPIKLTPAPRPLPPSELAPRPTPKGSERRTIISAAALATTIEAPAPCKPTKRPRPTKRPWKSAVLVAASAIAVAGVVAGVIAARLSARTPDLAAPALDGDGVPAILIRVRDVAMESPISLRDARGGSVTT